ncbi:MAG: single-stranded DNA-binding protein [Candidatus Omnitrophica bacterium]|nr:single-stranded DNA-binding protein [Candidatus Omnitrophota bacterium]MDD4013483.1 single-stranded DNA-binding protein [Candidatus Omnitrophota bacterium]
MAASLNKVFLMGNLTRDPELRYVPSGKAVANFSVAVSRAYKDAAGAKKEDVSFIRVIVWGKMAEICGEYLTKGRPVLVEGRLQSRSWEGQDGQKRNTLEVVANSVQFLGARSDKKAAGPAQPEESSGGPYSEIASIDVEKEGIEGEDIPF